MAVIIPFNPKRFDSVPFSEVPFTNGLTTRFSIRKDSEGSGYMIVTMLLPPKAADAAVLEMMERYMAAGAAKPKPKRKTRRRA